MSHQARERGGLHHPELFATWAFVTDNICGRSRSTMNVRKWHLPTSLGTWIFEMVLFAPNHGFRPKVLRFDVFCHMSQNDRDVAHQWPSDHDLKQIPSNRIPHSAWLRECPQHGISALRPKTYERAEFKPNSLYICLYLVKSSLSCADHGSLKFSEHTK